MERERPVNDVEVSELAARFSDRIRALGLRVGTAESCTGGWLARVLTDFPGSSDIYEGGWVCYSNEAKVNMLGVQKSLIDTHGAVSEQVVDALCRGVLKKSTANLSIGISGVAGPGGGSPQKPVGTVWIGIGLRDKPVVRKCWLFAGNREAVRRQAVLQALSLGLAVAEGR